MCSLSHSLAPSLSRLLAHLITRSVALSPTRPSESRSLALLLTRSLAHSLFRSLAHSLNPSLSCCSLRPALPLSPDDLLSRCLARALGCRFAAPTVTEVRAREALYPPAQPTKTSGSREGWRRLAGRHLSGLLAHQLSRPSLSRSLSPSRFLSLSRPPALNRGCRSGWRNSGTVIRFIVQWRMD